MYFATVDDGGASGDAVAMTCAPNPNVPDPITIAGRAFRYTSFDNTNSAPLAGVTVTAYQPGTTMMLGSPTTSDGTGAYALAIPSGGNARPVSLAYALTGYYQSNLHMAFFIDRDYSGTFQPVWTVGDAPLWNSTQMDQIYAAVGQTRDTGKATVNVAVRDCAGQPLAGATVTMSPPPALMRYQASDGSTGTDPTTVAPFAHMVAFNAEPMLTMFTVTAAGFTFPSLSFVVLPGAVNNLVVMRADPP